MSNFRAFAASIILSFAISTLAGPIVREDFISHPITKVSSKSITSIIANDQARLANYNSASNSSSTATVTNDVESYIASVKVGSQTFNLIVDTGSSNTWVGADTKFSAGSTAKSTGKSVSVSYGSGSFKGTEYTDTVTVGSSTVSQQSIGVASDATGFTGVDGIIGFGPVDLTQNTVSGSTTVPTFMDNLLSTGAISTEILGVSFAPESGSDNDDANGALTFGGTDSSKFSGSITYAPKSTNTNVGPYWGVDVASVGYDSTSLTSSSTSAIVDTGTTLIYIPSDAYAKFLSTTGGKADATTGLTKFTKAPTGTITFKIAGASLNLTPAQYLVPKAQYSNFGISGSESYSWINSGGDSGVDFIIGQKFLENYYTVFDTTNSQIGFATSTA